MLPTQISPTQISSTQISLLYCPPKFLCMPLQEPVQSKHFLPDIPDPLKVRETKPEDGDATSGQHHHLVDQGKDVMSLMAEVAGALNNEVNKGKTSSRKSSLLQRAISHTGEYKSKLCIQFIY